jgi:hypothetical protein
MCSQDIPSINQHPCQLRWQKTCTVMSF